MLFYMEASRAGITRDISTGNVQVLLNLMSAMAVKQPAPQVTPLPQNQVLPEHQYRQQVSIIRTQMATRADNPKTSIKQGKLIPRMHERDPAVKPEMTFFFTQDLPHADQRGHTGREYWNG